MENTTENGSEKKWVKFDENDAGTTEDNKEPTSQTNRSNYNGAVIETETVQVDLEKVKQLAQKSSTSEPQTSVPLTTQVMRNINLNDGSSQEERVAIETTIQRGFGKIEKFYF